MLRKMIDSIAGRAELQDLFNMFYRAGLYGMNYGNGGDFRKSGEKNVVQYIKKKLSKDVSVTIFDVGANKGFYSLDLADNFANWDVKIHAFEPSAVTFGFLLKTLSGVINIIPNNFGLSNENGELNLYSNNPLSGLASVYKRQLNHINIQMSSVEKIALKKLDDYCEENAISQIHFLKMDIEGHEFKCLEGAKRMLDAGKIQFIQFEFGGCNIDSRTFFQDFWYLLQDKYKIYRIVKNGLVLIPSYNERLEIFKNINFFAERK